MFSFSRFLRVLQSLLLEDWWLKIACLFMAILMWLYIDAELTDQSDFLVGIRPADIDLPMGWELSPDTVMPKFLVRLRGPRRRLQLFGADSIAFRKQILANPQQGRNTINVSPQSVEAEGLEVVNVTPKDDKGAVLNLIATARRLKRVRAKTIGRVNPKFVAEPPTTDPDQVSIEGPSEELDQIENVWTEDVDVNDAEQDVVRDVSVVPYVDVGGKRISFRCNVIAKVSVRVHPEQVTRRMTLDVRPLTISGTALTVEPKSVEVEVQAEEQEFAGAEFASSILLFVEWPRAWEVPKDSATVLGPLPVQVRASPPPRVTIRGINGAALPSVNVRGALAPSLAK